MDYIIVGQGIAGTMLAWFLKKHQKSFVVIDRFNPASSSQIAAGIIHPVTGRRIVKTWMADILIPFAENAYSDLEKFLSTRFFHPTPILELIDNVKDYNDWLSRSAAEEMKSYINTSANHVSYDEFLKPFAHKILIQHSSWVDLRRLLSAFRNYLAENDLLIEEAFDHSKLSLKNDTVQYGNIGASKIIFCEGSAALKNPLWKHLPFIPSKGEILTIKCETSVEHIINRKIFILPVGDNLFKVGSTYNWNDMTDTPTEESKQNLLGQLKEIIKVPFEVVNHEAAIRPSVKNRRPFLGLHPQYKNTGIFNGLGTKGCLLAPFFANHLAEFLVGKTLLMDEVNVSNQVLFIFDHYLCRTKQH